MAINTNTQAYAHNEEEWYGRIRFPSLDSIRSLYVLSAAFILIKIIILSMSGHIHTSNDPSLALHCTLSTLKRFRISNHFHIVPISGQTQRAMREQVLGS